MAPAQPVNSLISTIAPLDVASARMLLFNVLLARQAGAARVVLRVLDDAGAGAATISALTDDLGWLGFASNVDILPTAERAPLYRDVAAKLKTAGRAAKAGGTLILPLGPGETVVADVLNGRVTFDNRSLGDLMLVDAAGAVDPVFAAAVDEALLGTRVILREDREREAVARQQHVLAALDLAPRRVAHAGVLLPDDGALPTVGQLRRAGIEPGALLDHLALLGWSPRVPRESFALPDLVAAFSLDRLNHAPAHFNAARLRAFNARALRALPRAERGAQLAAAMQRAGLLEAPVPEAARRWIDTFLDAYGEAFATLDEALAIVAALRAEAVTVPALELERLRNRQVVFYLDAVGQYVDAQPELRGLPLEHDLPAIAAEFGIAVPDAFSAVRMALTGTSDGPPLALLFPLLGHDRILIRIGAISSHLLHGRGLEPIKYGPGGVPFKTIQPERPAPG